MKKRFFTLCMFLLLLLLGWGQPTPSQNHLVVRQFRAPVPAGSPMPALTDLSRVRSEVRYFDGLGRPLEQVSVRATPAGADQITFQQYDPYGREPVRYLPYVRGGNDGSFRPNPVDEQDLYYEPFYWPHLPVTDLDAPFSVAEFERSPLGRVVEQGAPAAAWQPERDVWGHSTRRGHTRRTAFRANFANEVAWFPPGAGGGFQVTQSYPPGALQVETVWNEHGNQSLTYRDKQGLVILEKTEIDAATWAETYRIYDAFGRPAIVIQPEGVVRLFSNQAAGKLDSVLSDYAFQFRYDERGRVTGKKVPGAGWQELVYDPLDRQRLSRDANLQAAGKWRFTKYDALGRPVQKGVVADSRSQAALQALLAGQTLHWENEGNVQGYSNQSFPDITAANCELLGITYYDHYDFNRDGDPGDPEESFSADPVLAQVQPESVVISQVTAERNRILGENRWLLTVNWYDRFGQLVQRAVQNHLGGEDRITQTYTFTGELREQHTRHQTISDSVQVYEKWDYDAMGRALRNWHDVRRGTGTWTPQPLLLAHLGYDELGQLTQKDLHGPGKAGPFLQELDFRYHLRGWLTDINRVRDSCVQAVLSEDPVEEPVGGDPMLRTGQAAPADLFALKLYYETHSGLHSGGSPRFDGRIAAISWQHKGACAQGYAFAYDGMGRLRSAWYAERSGQGQWGARDRYNGSYAYDRNGNLLSLDRKGLVGTNSFGWIDRLTYAYKGNQLVQVEDAVTASLPAGLAHFRDAAHLPLEYHYDAAGNLIRDENRGLASVVYTHFHKPLQVSFAGSSHNLTFTYAADGARLRKGFAGLESDYVGGFLYRDSTLTSIQHGEGRIVITGPGQRDVDYQYYLKDHLGNVRVVCRAGSRGVEAIQVTDYYPFGMNHSGGQARIASPESPYQYNGMERIGELDATVYDAPFRNLDVALGRWWQVDPVSEGFEAWSPYNANLNDPIYNSDPDGDCPRCLKILGKIGIKSIRKGKLDMSAIVELGQDAWAIVDPSSTWFDRAEGAFNILSPVDTREIKAGMELYEQYRRHDDELAQLMKSADEGAEWVFRGDLRKPDEIFKQGFWAKGDNDDLVQHVMENPLDSRFISTSKDVNVATQFTGKEGYVYLIRKPNNGIDINKEVPNNLFKREKEVAIPKKIGTEEIMGAVKAKGGVLEDLFNWNPYFKP